MKELIAKLEKTKVIDLNKELKDLYLNQDEMLFLSSYITLNSISLVRESLEFGSSDSEISEEVKEFLTRVKKGKLVEDITDKNYEKYINKAISNAIKNMKISYSLIELIEEAYLVAAVFLKTYYEKLREKYEENVVFDIFDVYVSIKLLYLQIENEKKDFNLKMGAIAYLKINDQLENSRDLKDILKEMNISKSYYEHLKQNYEGLYIEDLEDTLEYASIIRKEYEELRDTFMFNYIEESFLISFLGLEGHKYTKQELMNKFKMTEEVLLKTLNGIFKKASETSETY